jgi:AraC-like DNA-binding protein
MAVKSVSSHLSANRDGQGTNWHVIGPPQLNSLEKPSGSLVESGFGLFRREALRSGPVASVQAIFADLRAVRCGQVFGEDPQRDTQGIRLMADGSLGHGFWEFYRLGQDLYIITGDSVYNTVPRMEILPGEGLLEFHLRLSGGLILAVPGIKEPLNVIAPCMLILHQPAGVNILERTLPQSRDAGVSLYCRPEYLAELAGRNGIPRWTGLDEIAALSEQKIWARQVALSPTLMHIANSLLRNPYRGGVRLLFAESTALALLCEILGANDDTGQARKSLQSSETEAQQLDHARRLLASRLSSSPRTRDVARAVGMSETKLKRTFKAKFGETVFDYGLGCRMRHALELLRCKHKPVGYVARAVGYRHPTSFTTAFQQFFGFSPNAARMHMH